MFRILGPKGGIPLLEEENPFRQEVGLGFGFKEGTINQGNIIFGG